jgi:hypothetical protein
VKPKRIGQERETHMGKRQPRQTEAAVRIADEPPGGQNYEVGYEAKKVVAVRAGNGYLDERDECN